MIATNIARRAVLLRQTSFLYLLYGCKSPGRGSESVHRSVPRTVQSSKQSEAICCVMNASLPDD